jgi:hypothetical protein
MFEKEGMGKVIPRSVYYVDRIDREKVVRSIVKVSYGCGILLGNCKIRNERGKIH